MAKFNNLEDYQRYYAALATPIYEPTERAVFMNDVFGFFRDQIADFARWLYKKTHGLDPLTTIRDLRQDLALAEQGNKFLRGELNNLNTCAKSDSVASKELYAAFAGLREETTKLLRKWAKGKVPHANDAKPFAKYGIALTVVPKKKKAK